MQDLNIGLYVAESFPQGPADLTMHLLHSQGHVEAGGRWVVPGGVKDRMYQAPMEE